MALRYGTLNRERRESAEAEARKNAAAQVPVAPIAPIDEAAITAAVTEHAAKLAAAADMDTETAKAAIESVMNAQP